MDQDRLEKLLDLYFDEGLTDVLKQEFEQMLLASPHAREIFWSRAELNSMLRQHGQESWGQETTVTESTVTESTSLTLPSPSGNSLSHQWFAILIAASLLVAMGTWWAYRNNILAGSGGVVAQLGGDDRELRNEVASDADRSDVTRWVALLRGAVDVQWQDETREPRVGDLLPARQIKFQSGLVEIQTKRGALIVLEGPADMEIISDMEIRCNSGRLRVDVPPPAIGFLVHTPRVKVVDQGTSFAVNVGENDATEVHVIDGMVELVSSVDKVPMRQLLEGEAVDIASSGDYRVIPSKTKSFPSASKMTARTQAANIVRRTAWQRRRDTMTQRPDCLLYFDFEKSARGDTVLENRVPNAPSASVGTIIGCQWTQGRWPGKRALDFKNLSDRVRFALPGPHTTLTCITSLRLDSLDTAFNSLLMSGDATQGEIQWQISRQRGDNSSGRLRFGRRSESQWSAMDDYLSKPIFQPEQFGQWMQLAFVWDAQSGICSQYVDGRLVSQEKIHSSNLDGAGVLQTDQLEIGNWTPKDALPSELQRNFNGRMDEFVVFDSALQPEDILAYYDLTGVSWKDGGDDDRWSNPDNWFGGNVPTERDIVYVDQAGEDKAVLAEAIDSNLEAVVVGSTSGKQGEFEIAGGSLTAMKNSSRQSRVGVAGGKGKVSQTAGIVNLNGLQIGLDLGSKGDYQLSGGQLSIVRGVNTKIGSLDVGSQQGTGNFEISGGSLVTRVGVTLGRDEGNGTFSVLGSKATKIQIGAFQKWGGSWVQHIGSKLHAQIDSDGLSRIEIMRGRDESRGNVTFAEGAVLDVSFAGAEQSGSWDVMTWQGTLTNHGLKFADSVDTNRWSFEFVDTNASGNPDTLRVTAAEHTKLEPSL